MINVGPRHWKTISGKFLVSLRLFLLRHCDHEGVGLLSDPLSLGQHLFFTPSRRQTLWYWVILLQ